jgi:DNA-directed RNA polymerase subunit RPC12/RpoP
MLLLNIRPGKSEFICKGQKMTITFHCERCKKQINAPDNTGGKWGSCPHCKHRCYVPLPPDDSEEQLTLAPIDENEESKYHEMMRETFDLTKNILSETDVPKEDKAARPGAAEYNERELIKNIIFYLRQMAGGKLDQAQTTAEYIKPFKKQAQDILKRMARTERPEPELADIAPTVLKGLIKNLSSQL